MIAAAGLILEHQLTEDYREWQKSWWHPVWENAAEELAVIDDSRMPEWAADQYVLCLYWENTYSRRDELARKGPDLVELRTGIGWGWILINRELEHHVLERGLTFSKLEDGIEVQSASKIIHSAWTKSEDQD